MWDINEVKKRGMYKLALFSLQKSTQKRGTKPPQKVGQQFFIMH